MRIVKTSQLHFGQVDISEIKLDPRSRDDIPAVLKGLQYIYTTENIRERVFALLESALPKDINQDTGRPGMELWKIFVLATLKLGINSDFDRLQELANSHLQLRQMLGHSGWEDTYHYKLQTVANQIPIVHFSNLFIIRFS